MALVPRLAFKGLGFQGLGFASLGFGGLGFCGNRGVGKTWGIGGVSRSLLAVGSG